jgi:hypothetical protein
MEKDDMVGDCEEGTTEHGDGAWIRNGMEKRRGTRGDIGGGGDNVEFHLHIPHMRKIRIRHEY